MGRKYYWAGSLPLEPGSIVLPGNWYRLVAAIPGHQCALREEVAERVRRESYADLPSRKNALFLCDSLESLKRFLTLNSRPFDLLYEVTLVNPTAKICTVDSELTKLQNMSDGGRPLTIDEHVEQAKQYWASASGESPAYPEVVTESPIRIVRRVM